MHQLPKTSSDSIWRHDWLRAVVAAITTLIAKWLTSGESALTILPLPEELHARGWVFAVVFVAVGVLLGHATKQRRHESHSLTLEFLAIVLFLVLAAVHVAAFYWIESAWKQAENRFTIDVLYFWAEPLAVGLSFGFVASALTVAFRVLDQLVATQSSPR
jgi:hypothetical protein